VTYDQKCADLAAHFLNDGEDKDLIPYLAQYIQNAVEEYFDLVKWHREEGSKP